MDEFRIKTLVQEHDAIKPKKHVRAGRRLITCGCLICPATVQTSTSRPKVENTSNNQSISMLKL